MTHEQILDYVILSILTTILLFSLIKLKQTLLIFGQIADDTLKKKDNKGNLKWSRTSLTMFTAWIIAIYMAIYDMTKSGFKFEVFLAFVGVALGSKIADGFSKSLDPTNKKTKDDNE